MQDPKKRTEIITSALNEKLGERKLECPISGDKAIWEVHINTTVVPAMTDPSVAPRVIDRSYPLAVVMCKHCGYTILINLIVLGLAEQLGIHVEPEGAG